MRREPHFTRLILLFALGVLMVILPPAFEIAAFAPTKVDPSQNTLILIDDSTEAYYNEKLGTVLGGTQPQFPGANCRDGDPTIVHASEPDLTIASTVLGGWLSSAPLPLNENWSGPQAIPARWPINTETAIVYVVHAGPNGIVDLHGDFGVDNGLFVWVNGEYKFGALEPGPVRGYEYSRALGDLPPGENYIQVLREDHGSVTDYTVQITGTYVEIYQLFLPAILDAVQGRKVTGEW